MENINSKSKSNYWHLCIIKDLQGPAQEIYLHIANTSDRDYYQHFYVVSHKLFCWIPVKNPAFYLANARILMLKVYDSNPA